MAVRRTILIVAMPFSIHTARWVSQLDRDIWDVHLFSSMAGSDLNEEMTHISFHEYFYLWSGQRDSINYKDVMNPILSILGGIGVGSWVGKLFRVFGIEKSRAAFLARVINKVKPDIIHSLESQHAGYLVDETKKSYRGNFPIWIHSNWGIDLHFFGRIESHRLKIRSMLTSINVFVSEGKRDIELARKYGFKGFSEVFPSVGGGFTFPEIEYIPTSKRKLVLVKGSQDLVRRGLVAIRALERCVDVLDPYEIVIFSSNEVTRVAAELLSTSTGRKVRVAGHVKQIEMFDMFSKARLVICVNMSDGVPNAMLESMAMGAFPIQSNTSMAEEWIEDDKTGFLVPPEDPDVIEIAIRKALTNDNLVDEAASINMKKIREELDYEKEKVRVLKFYSELLNQ